MKKNFPEGSPEEETHRSGGNYQERNLGAWGVGGGGEITSSAMRTVGKACGWHTGSYTLIREAWPHVSLCVFTQRVCRLVHTCAQHAS